MPCKQKGFTLIELIVVMAILSLLSVIGYRAMTTALNTHQGVSVASERLRELELGLFLLTKDLKQIQRLPIPNGAKPFLSDAQSENNSGQLFRFYRAADVEMRQGVVEVSYYLEKQQLLQQVVVAGEIFKTPIMNAVQSINVTFYDNRHQQTTVWQQNTLPSVIEMVIEHQRYGTLIIKEAISE